MSLIDYGQAAEDHQTLLFLVRHTGSKLSFKNFNRIWERINKISVVNIPGQKRRAWVNFKRGYPKENNEWGDFQAHRKALGLVSVGECSNSDEFEELFDNYRKVKEEYAGTLYNSRLFVFGMNPDGSTLSDEQKENLASGRKLSPTHSEDSGVTADLSPTEGQDEVSKTDGQTIQNSNLGNTEKVKNSSPKPENPGVIFIKPEKPSKDNAKTSKEDVKRSHSNSLTKENTGSEVVFYPRVDECVDIEEKIHEFVASIFFVLEGKRLDRSFEKMDKMQLLCAPFEKKDYVGLDTDTKSFRKKCQGRLRKHLADLCLQAGYAQQDRDLKPVKQFGFTLHSFYSDTCFEGLCSASVILIYPQMQAPQLRRNYSLSVTRGSSMVHERGTEVFQLRQIQTLPITCIVFGSMKNLSNGWSDMPETVIKTALNPDDIIEKYKEALMHYSKEIKF
ncbi:hypothetical protein KUTeg_000095 [Tegillarca granosa]|uniref:Trs120/TRAPPC9 N-terminal domain-containing protein n=1 Tax=Tegillarca granosa TaxID=220873 RepID=A0ABQ9FWJ8_TEGGR|nr:hypothetical protein KUTeg_000095 [Tegillarca granosa]